MNELYKIDEKFTKKNVYYAFIANHDHRFSFLTRIFYLKYEKLRIFMCYVFVVYIPIPMNAKFRL